MTDIKYIWSRTSGYEVSSKGDIRFSAMYATMPDGRTIEQHYQCDVKGYDVGGTNWRLGKGKPSLRQVSLYLEYLTLWRTWSNEHTQLLDELADLVASKHHYILRDRFASTSINQARALADLLNERR